MVDAVGTITKVVEVALKIKKAADTAKQNEDVCKQIKDRVDILSKTLSQHQNNTELMDNLAVAAALEALDETLGEALKLVMECQEETSFVCLLYTAGNLSEKLIKAEQRISSKNVDAMFAIMGYLLPGGFNQDSSHPPSQQVGSIPTTVEPKRVPFSVYSSGRQRPSQFQDDIMQPPNRPIHMWRQNQDEEDASVQTDHASYVSIFNRARDEHSARNKVDIQVSEVDPVTSNRQWDSSMEALCSCCAMAKKRKPVPRPSSSPDDRPRSLLHQIAEVALVIKEASETVLQYREDCVEIAKRVSRVSALLSQLENTEIVERQAMKDELTKLLEVFRRAHTLVMVCQRSGMITTFVCSPPCKLSEQLNALLDQFLPHVNAIIAVLVNSTLRPQRNRYMSTRNVHGRPRESRSVQPARSIPRRNVGDGEINDASCYAAAPLDATDPARAIPRLKDQEQ
ncbi:hypothetical protein C2845_PM05G18270 [Panicum miliaceum]|uniref:Mixed lineage kinase domain-containing protein n=1 Tax=Panicum miliaceum TaxID=4540 RepID=A0A3L6ST09_PANMI|nr:hypothetical protein C2845_PM05G18270 [Panicum miliaceum]